MEQNMGYSFHQMPEQVDEILGEDFWWDIQKTIPKRGPCMDVYQDVNRYLLVVELPGISEASGISVRQIGQKISISGEIPYIYSIDKKNLIRNERFIGSFSREFPIPFPFHAEQIHAVLKTVYCKFPFQKTKNRKLRFIFRFKILKRIFVFGSYVYLCLCQIGSKLNVDFRTSFIISFE